MPFVTTLTLRSGDRDALDGAVENIRSAAERKGLEITGPHTRPPDEYRVPLYQQLTRASDQFPSWDYAVYERVVTLGGHDEAVRGLAERDFPTAVHVAVDIEHVQSTGHS